MSDLSMDRRLENVPKETLLIGPVSKLQKNFVHGEDVHGPPFMS